jgi:hypothetical protein
VSAGFAPISLGTQTGGSLIYPASKAGLYAMLPTLTTVSTEGAFRISRSFDGIGGIAKTSADLATLTEAILLPETRKSLLKGGYISVMSGSWLGLKVGVVESTWGGANPEKWASELVVSISVIMSPNGIVSLILGPLENQIRGCCGSNAQWWRSHIIPRSRSKCRYSEDQRDWIKGSCL